MRKGFFHGLALVLSLSLLSAMCSSDDDGSQSNNNAEIAQVENTLETGTWRVANMVDSGQDETNDFSGYEFTFASNGTITATNGTTSYTGSWFISDDDSSDDDSSDDDLEFNIFFNVPDSNDFEDLNDDWDIVSYSDNTINLIDISGGNGDTDILTFERN
jgi:hypothetical protein